MTPLPNDVRARLDAMTTTGLDGNDDVHAILRAYDEAVAEVAKATPTIDEQLNAHRLELVGEVERLAAENARLRDLVAIGILAGDIPDPEKEPWAQRAAQLDALATENARLREAWKTRAPYLPDAPLTGPDLAARYIGAKPIREVLGADGRPARQGEVSLLPPLFPKHEAPAVEAPDAIDRGEQWGHAIGRHDEFCIYTADAVFGPRAHCDSQATADRIVDTLNGFEEATRLLRIVEDCLSEGYAPISASIRGLLARLDAKGGGK